jgi:hypothetical protein
MKITFEPSFQRALDKADAIVIGPVKIYDDKPGFLMWVCDLGLTGIMTPTWEDAEETRMHLIVSNLDKPKAVMSTDDEAVFAEWYAASEGTQKARDTASRVVADLRPPKVKH